MVKIDKEVNNYRPAIIFGLSSVVAILIIIFAIAVPMYNKWTKKKAELKIKQTELNRLEDKLSVLENLKDKEEVLKVQNQKVLSALPKDKDVARLFYQIEGIANINNLSITSVVEDKPLTTAKSKTPSTTTSLTKHTYVVKGTATSYAGIKQTLAKIESALRVVSVDKVVITKSASTLEVTMTLSTYSRGE